MITDSTLAEKVLWYGHHATRLCYEPRIDIGTRYLFHRQERKRLSRVSRKQLLTTSKVLSILDNGTVM